MIRLAYLQIDQAGKFSDLGKKNFLRTEVLSPPRGNLVDCNGVLLAANRPVFDLYWEGTANTRLNLQQEDILEKIEEILQFRFDNNLLIRIKNAEKYSKRILLKSDITFDQLCCISEQCRSSLNLIISSRFKRIYPYRNLASHILGYLSKREEDYTTIGLYGVEKMFQNELKGETGYVLNVINSTGRKLDQRDSKDAKAGNDIKLTLDLQLQSIAETLFEQDQTGAFILMDPIDGSIKAMVSYPNFDPNIFLDPIAQEDWEGKLTYNKPLLNRNISALYPPASIFKLVTFAAGLEEGVIDFDSEFECKGFLNFYGRKYHCIRRWGHSKLNLKTALAYSCNIPCFDIGLRMKINQLADYAFRFGLGRRTGFLLPEREGLVPTYEWKVATKNEPWWKGETLSVSIGHSFTLVTPLQMVRMIASICTGYLVKPRILYQEEIEKEDLCISQNTLKFLRKAMKEVVAIGSAKVLRDIKDVKVYAKTGTAQTTSLDRKKISKDQLEHAWLASFFKYKKQKPLAMIVLVENVGSSQPAKKIAYNFLNAYKQLKETKI